MQQEEERFAVSLRIGFPEPGKSCMFQEVRGREEEVEGCIASQWSSLQSLRRDPMSIITDKHRSRA